MKGDFTRNTFKPEQHFSSVRQQQGRVQLDADWNEQIDIAARRVEVETGDSLGGCAAPLHTAGFGVTADPTTLSTAEQQRLTDLGLLPLAAGDFLLTPGRFYVDGILVEIEHATPFTAQPDLPGITPIAVNGIYLAYLDVWQRHLTALEAPNIREVALGGPDTATRTRTTWQAKLLTVPAGSNCLSDLAAWDTLVAGSTGRLAARAQPETASTDPCIVPASAGFRGLQNQLYRVEIHQGGALNTATFKWSRDNGSLVFAVDEFVGGQPTTRLRLRSLGRDGELGLHKGDWVEVLDDENELADQNDPSFTPGTLAQIVDIDEDDLIITLSTTVNGLDVAAHAKVRRWDSAGPLVVRLPAGNDGYIPLEDGVEVRFAAGSYQTGDYWLIPARTILGNPTLTQTGGIEWPSDGAGDPLAQPPAGIRHHYCRLAVLTLDDTGLGVQDCRPLFPPLTELTSLFSLGGDGQEAMPGQFLPQPLRAGVSNGEWPVAGARVRFRVLAGSGSLNGGAPGAELIVPTGADGVASTTWRLDATTLSQVIEATLLDVAGDDQHLKVHYNANLSLASQVAYTTECEGLARSETVQDALDLLCRNAWLRYVGGDGQNGQPGAQLAFPLEVRLANGGWPVAGENVVFRLMDRGGGRLDSGGMSGDEVIVRTDADGYAACAWTLGRQLLAQQVIAFWERRPDHFIHFNAFIVRGGEPTEEPAIHIRDVFLMETGAPLVHDSVIGINDLSKGILVSTDEPLSPLAARGKPVFTLTLEMPFPLNPMDREFYGNELIGFQPLVLHSDTFANGNELIWQPGPNVINFLFQIDSRSKELGVENLLVHLKVKGNFIWGENESLHIDGEAFAGPNGLNLPSGNGVRGGDFELWFRLVEG